MVLGLSAIIPLFKKISAVSLFYGDYFDESTLCRQIYSNVVITLKRS